MTLPADLAVIVVNYGSSDLLERNLTGLADATDAARIIVVDNFRTHGESEAVSALCARRGWTLLSHDSNLGFGAGTNAGAALAIERGAERLLLVNPDARIDPSIAFALAEECAANPRSIVCPRIVRPDGSTWFGGATVLVAEGTTSTAPGTDSAAPGGWVTGACMMVHAELWRDLGGFDDDYFLYWEDVDLSWRCTGAGGALRVRHDLTVTHTVGGTQQESGKSATYVYFNCRNRLIFAAKHLDRRQILGWLANSPGYAWRVLQRGGRRSLARRPVSLLGAAIAGTASGSVSAMRRMAAAR